MKKWLTVLFLFNLALRIALINWHPAQYTDSILYMKALETVRGTIILPAYPFAIVLLRKIFSDPVLSGRLVSILAASLAVFPLFGLTRAIAGRRAAFLTGTLYTFSPLILRWSLRIFPHALYSLFLLLAAYGIFKYLEAGRAPWVALGVFSSGLAALTYPTGLVMAPVALVAFFLFFIRRLSTGRQRFAWLMTEVLGAALLAAAFFRLPPFRSRLKIWFGEVLSFFPVNFPGPVVAWQLAFVFLGEAIVLLIFFFLLSGPRREKGWWYRRPAVVVLLISSWSAHVFLYVWKNFLARSDWYQQGMRTSWQSVAGRWETWLSHYLRSYPYILVYPVAAACVVGVVFLAWTGRRKKIRWLWLVFYAYFFAGITYALVVNKWWTPRYQYCLIPFALVIAGSGLSWGFGRPRLRWAAWAFTVICLAASVVFTSFVIYWSRDSFGDMRRAALFARDHQPAGRIFSTELVKCGFWAKIPLRGYTWRNRLSIRPGDAVILTGWHINLAQYFRDLNRRFTTRVLRREKSVIRPLLADDIVDWAGQRLPRRANDPILWREKFNKQTLESWVVEIGDPRGEGEAVSEPPVPERALLTEPDLEKAHYFDVGVWPVLREVPAGEKVFLRMAHARSGPEGGFNLVAYTDSDGDNLPDKPAARSEWMESTSPGGWSEWEFVSPGGKLFVGSTWKLGNWVYYLKPPWPRGGLGGTMYYSRGGIPQNRAFRITRMEVSFSGDSNPDQD